MLLLDGKHISNEIKNELKKRILKLNKKGIKPGLGIILVGNRPDSEIYVRMKKKACNEIGIINYDVNLEEKVSEEKIIEEIEMMNNNNNIHGILIQLPLPSHINKEKVISCVKLEKDVDGFHPYNIGKLALKRLNNLMIPCTPEGCIELLDRYKIEIQSKHVVIVGRSNIVGMPLSLLFLHRNATVTICHSKTKNIEDIIKTADILIAACGKAKMINSSNIREGCVILDVGINRIRDSSRKSGYRLVGDVDFDDVKTKCSAITPVPGGIGPMTIAILLKHTVDLACLYL
jgi:5,10-methylene-tetrahydrofolate dehydrogenase/methenyl tetrahydrofolate cyclohydrolase